jgi:hypothetical protein
MGVAYDYLTRADHGVMGGMLGLATSRVSLPLALATGRARAGE